MISASKSGDKRLAAALRIRLKQIGDVLDRGSKSAPQQKKKPAKSAGKSKSEQKSNEEDKKKLRRQLEDEFGDLSPAQDQSKMAQEKFEKENLARLSGKKKRR